MNAVIYARYSSHSQSEQSIEGQLRDCYSFAERQELVIVGEYIDRALSGKTDDRPDFQRMIADAPKKQFDYVIVWKLDRFARNRYDSAVYKMQLKKQGVGVLSACENIGEGDESIILEAVLEASAEYFSRDLAKKVRRGHRENARKGLNNGGTTPFGYRLEKKRLVIDENRAPIVRFIYDEYARGVPVKDILQALADRGVKNHAGNPMQRSSLQTLLRNTKYIGKQTYDGEEVAGGCPAIIDEETFERAQKRLETNKRAPARAKSDERYHLFGKAFCGLCGANLVGESGRGKMGVLYHYYNCINKKRFRSCCKRNERKDFLEWYVVEQTCEYVLTPARIGIIAKSIVDKYDDEFSDSRVVALEKRIARLDREIQKGLQAILQAGSASVQARLEELIEAKDAEKADMELDLARLRIATDIRYTEDQIKAWLRKFCEGDPLDPAFRRKIIDVFINSIYLYDDKLVVFYNVHGGRQVSYMEMLQASGDPPAAADGSPVGVRIWGDVVTHPGFEPGTP